MTAARSEQQRRRRSGLSRERELKQNQPIQIGQSGDHLCPGQCRALTTRNSASYPAAGCHAIRSIPAWASSPPAIRAARAAQSIEQAGSATGFGIRPAQVVAALTRKGKLVCQREREAAMASPRAIRKCRCRSQWWRPLGSDYRRGATGPSAAGAVKATRQATRPSRIAKTGKTEIAQNGMAIVHGSGNPGTSEQDIQIVRAGGQKQGKRAVSMVVFYGTSEQDAHTLSLRRYDGRHAHPGTMLEIKPGTKRVAQAGDITSPSESYINELVSQGYGVDHRHRPAAARQSM